MTKQELIQAAKEIREICKGHRICKGCPFSHINNACVFAHYPSEWDIERLECSEGGKD